MLRVFSRFPRPVGIEPVGFRVQQHGLFLHHPVGAVVAAEFRHQALIHGAQPGHIGERIVDLPVGKGTARPVREAGALVDPPAGKMLHQRVIGRLVAETADHGADLGVEQRLGDDAAHMEEDLDVLPRSVHHLGHRRGQQPPHGRHIEAGRQRIHRPRLLRVCKLEQAELGPIGRIPHELGIDRHIVRFLQTGAECVEVRLGLYEARVGSRNCRLGHGPAS